MPSILSKNCITSGQIDYYCLPCSNQFLSETTAVYHTIEDTHKEQLVKWPYLEKYTQDLIRKIRGFYFCESCDKIFYTATKVSLHVQEADHIEQLRKAKTSIERKNHSIQTFGNVAIANEAWNGVMNQTCLLCNLEFDDISQHITDETHVLNLIQSKVVSIIAPEVAVYRKIDNNFIQCLTCNELIPESGVSKHVASLAHKTLLKHVDNNLTQNNAAFNTKENITTNNNNGVEKNNNVTNTEALKKGTTTNKTGTSKENQPKTETKRKSNINSTLPLKKDKMETKKNTGKDIKTLHIKTTPSSNSTSNTKSRTKYDKAYDYARKNAFMFDEFNGERLYYCKPCDMFCPPKLRSLQDHVNYTDHTNKLALQTDPKLLEMKPKKENLIEFIDELNLINIDDVTFAFINNKYVIGGGSFVLISQFCGGAVCKVCEIDFKMEDLKRHLETEAHKGFLTNCYFLASMPHEFIRQITLHKYHCGFCNVIEADYDDMLEHITTEDHYSQKMKACYVREKIQKNNTPTVLEVYEFMKALELLSNDLLN